MAAQGDGRRHGASGQGRGGLQGGPQRVDLEFHVYDGSRRHLQWPAAAVDLEGGGG
jgi:hypothetical protein